MIDLDHYTWREPVLTAGETRLLIPHWNEYAYEFPMNGIFKTVEEAEQYLVDFDVDPEESERWTLIHFKGEVIRPGNYEVPQEEVFDGST